MSESPVRVDISGLVWADYRPGQSLRLLTPTQQLTQHAADRLRMRSADSTRLALSSLDSVILTARTNEFIDRFLPSNPDTARRLKAEWRRSAPRVNPLLPVGTAEYV